MKIFHRALYLLLVIGLSVSHISPAFALDEPFYSGNDILFYDPDVTSCAPSNSVAATNLEGSANAEKILNYFVGKGLTLAAAAGFAGNMKQESGLRPEVIQGGATAPANYKPVNGVGFGLVQWTFGGTTSSRQGGLYKLSQSQNKPIIDMGLQLDYVWKELTGPYKQSTLDKVKSATDPVTAAIIVHDNYEISADSDSAVRTIRGGNAKAYYDQYKSVITDGSGSVTTTATTGDSCGGEVSSAGGLGVANGFTFPLKTTQATIKKGIEGAVWCYTKTTNCHHDYNAADIFAETGTPIIAAKGGKVVGRTDESRACTSSSTGCNVSVMGEDNVLYYYTHMSKHAVVKTGQTVQAGQQIGSVGTNVTAMGTPRHLHIDMLPGDKYKFRPSCSGAACSGYPLINIQQYLVPAFQALPQE